MKLGSGANMVSTSEKLLDAARACLIEHGHHACSVKAIARRAGVNHGLVHHYFGSKEQLWVAVIRREAEQVRASLEAAPRAFMDGFFVPEMLRRPERIRLMIELLAMARAHPALAEAMGEHLRINREVLRRQLGLPDATTATLVFGAFFGMVVQAQVDSELQVESAARQLLALLSLHEEPHPTATPGTPPDIP